MTTTDNRPALGGSVKDWVFWDRQDVDVPDDYQVRVVTDPGETMIEVRCVGSEATILTLDAGSARAMASLLVEVADAADAIRSLTR